MEDSKQMCNHGKKSCSDARCYHGCEVVFISVMIRFPVAIVIVVIIIVTVSLTFIMFVIVVIRFTVSVMIMHEMFVVFVVWDAVSIVVMVTSRTGDPQFDQDLVAGEDVGGVTTCVRPGVRLLHLVNGQVAAPLARYGHIGDGDPDAILHWHTIVVPNERTCGLGVLALEIEGFTDRHLDRPVLRLCDLHGARIFIFNATTPGR